MKRIIISQRVDDYPDRDERRDALDQKLPQLLYGCGYLTFPVPNLLSQPVPGATAGAGEALGRWIEEINPHGIVLSGGNDIGSCKERDDAEHQILEYSRDNELPVLGICHGMLAMAVFEGGELHQIDGHVRKSHDLNGEIAGKANSFHNYSLAECPENFDILARSEDGAIEAIKHQTHPWEGWMWHPERAGSEPDRDLGRIKKLFGK